MSVYQQYENLDLEIEATADGYRAHVIDSPVGQVDWTSFTLPFAAKELQQARTLFGQVRGWRLAQDNHEPLLDPKRFGSQLYSSVFGGEIGRCLSRSLEKVASDHGLRICLRLNNAADLADLPWEMLYGPSPFDFFALSPRTPIVRYLATDLAEESLNVDLPLHILAVIANPATLNAPALNVASEWEKLQQALAPLQARQQVVLERLETPTLAALQDRLRISPDKPAIHLLHFIGHGQREALIFTDEQGGPLVVPADSLKVLLQGYPALRLAFLNACEGGRSDEQDIFLGVAPALVRCGLPAVIAMKYSISDRAAIALSTEFYRALADGYPVEAALAEARKAIYVGQQSVEWGTPLLFSRSADNRLLTLPASGESATKKAQSTLPPASQSISTSGGMYSAGNVNVGGSLVGRDQIINNYYNPPTPAPAATPSPLLAAEITRKDFEPETILIAEGEFLMGSLPEPGISPYETPQHPVHLSAYRIGKYLVTNGEFEEFVQRTGWIVSPQMGWNGQAPYRDKRDFPVIGLTWYEALEYCRWLSKETERTYTLPNEAQWEKAERGVEGRLYPWGNEWEEGRCNIGGIGVAAKDKFPAQSVNGCYDWVGNVRQWTCGLWGEELREPDRQYLYKWKEDSRNHLQANNQIRRVWRGAAYSDKPPRARCSARGAELPTSAGLPNKWFGFRVVMLLTKEDNS